MLNLPFPYRELIHRGTHLFCDQPNRVAGPQIVLCKHLHEGNFPQINAHNMQGLLIP